MYVADDSSLPETRQHRAGSQGKLGPAPSGFADNFLSFSHRECMHLARWAGHLRGKPDNRRCCFQNPPYPKLHRAYQWPIKPRFRCSGHLHEPASCPSAQAVFHLEAAISRSRSRFRLQTPFRAARLRRDIFFLLWFLQVCGFCTNKKKTSQFLDSIPPHRPRSGYSSWHCEARRLAPTGFSFPAFGLLPWTKLHQTTLLESLACPPADSLPWITTLNHICNNKTSHRAHVESQVDQHHHHRPSLPYIPSRRRDNVSLRR